MNELQDGNELFLKCSYTAHAHEDDALEHNMFTASFAKTVRLWLNRRIVYSDLGVIFSDLSHEILNNFPILPL